MLQQEYGIIHSVIVSQKIFNLPKNELIQVFINNQHGCPTLTCVIYTIIVCMQLYSGEHAQVQIDLLYQISQSSTCKESNTELLCILSVQMECKELVLSYYVNPDV